MLINCDSKINYSKINFSFSDVYKYQKSFYSDEDKENWHFKDIIIDTIPGVSLKRMSDSILNNKNNEGNEIIVAILDSEIDINHKELKNSIWINKNEIPNNGIDDEGNGFIDDINGWNFLGNKKGENNNFTSYEYTRFLKKYNSIFKNKNRIYNSNKESLLFKHYKRAKNTHTAKLEYANEDIEYANMLLNSMLRVKNELKKYFFKKEYNLKDLDSLKKKFLNNKKLQEVILIRSNFIKYGFTQSYIDNYKLNAEERISKLLNLNHNDRELTGDNSDIIEDINYGNNLVNKNISLFEHGTKVAGSILSVRNKNIRIMPVCISPFGDEHDKDIALAIRYAVDNGAKVINMSFGKEFSLYPEWVFNAIKYAEKNNVLIVSSSGNSKFNLNIINDYFPNDNLENGKEVSDNFLLVGATSRELNENLIYEYSNYGNIDVDLFAPGENIYTTLPHNKYTFDSGTSLASAITSGVAALLFSYYPNLTSSEVKHILMDSGLEFELEVSTPTKDNKD
ncbi:MAG: S8 family serine peptidase, partial [Polaribacter sp.]|nr:S8 family serine peptidase [Polaribacter sp.]MDG1993094.1 S8 family serine peptidase [Polaribacter sp.]